jgi:hypothetical protein
MAHHSPHLRNLQLNRKLGLGFVVFHFAGFLIKFIITMGILELRTRINTIPNNFNT